MTLLDAGYTPIIFKKGRFRPPCKNKAYSLWYYYQNKEKALAYLKNSYNNGPRKKAYIKKREEAAHELNSYVRNWRKNNPEYMSKYMKQRRIDKPGLVKSEERLKMCNRNKRFIFKSFLPEIEEFYKNCPEGYVVDHIIPLQGKNVSGIHAPCNFQYLKKDENNFKRHKFDGTYTNDSWRLAFNT